jgi:hypothetical protein
MNLIACDKTLIKGFLPKEMYLLMFQSYRCKPAP